MLGIKKFEVYTDHLVAEDYQGNQHRLRVSDGGKLKLVAKRVGYTQEIIILWFHITPAGYTVKRVDGVVEDFLLGAWDTIHIQSLMEVTEDESTRAERTTGKWQNPFP